MELGVLQNFVRSQLELLELERTAEIEQCREFLESSSVDLERKGVALKNLTISSFCTGLYGKQVVSFESARKKELVSHSITCGDIVGVTQGTLDSSDFISSGIVCSVQRNCISVSFDQIDDLDFEDGQYCVVKLANDVTYKRLKTSLNSLGNCGGSQATPLINVLFGDSNTEEVPLNPQLLDQNESLEFFNKNLNKSQQDAVKFALCQKQLAIVHGPPGTGKTTTVVEILLQCVKAGNKVLVCAPSNVAVDNLLEKLVQFKTKRVVRLGHPARMLPSIQYFSLDAVLSSRDNAKIIEDVKSDLDKTLAKLKKSRKDARPKLRQEVKLFRKELRDRESSAFKEVLSSADIILCTLTTSSKDGPLKHVRDDHFDLVIIDECSQALESACWIPLQTVPKAILAGDHHQLPPTIISKEASEKGLELSLMERAIKKLGDKVVMMLTVQYRMHTNIMKWSSDKLYNSKLEANSLVADHLLKDLNEVQENEYSETPLLLIDTAGCDMPELETQDEVSKGNEWEADIVSILAKYLIKSGLKPSNIAVITPYNLQVELVRGRLSEFRELEVRTVDGFQGREKEAVILSLVRSNSKHELGFVTDVRRLNVAITRARRFLAVVADSETVACDPVISSLIEHLEKFGVVHSAHQYQSELDVYERPELKVKLAKVEKVPRENGSRSKENKPKNKVESKQRQKIQNQPKELISKSSHSMEETLEKKRKLEAVIQQFTDDSSQSVYEFPPSLTSFERMLIHEIAENHNLCHESVGENEERHIVLRKKNLNTEIHANERSLVGVFVNEGSDLVSVSVNANEDKVTFNSELASCPVESKVGAVSLNSELASSSVESKVGAVLLNSELASCSVESKEGAVSLNSELASSSVESKVGAVSLNSELASCPVESKVGTVSLNSELASSSVESNVGAVSLNSELTSCSVESKVGAVSLNSELASSSVESNVGAVSLNSELASCSVESNEGAVSVNEDSKYVSSSVQSNVKARKREKARKCETSEKSANARTCDYCKRNILLPNLITHQLHCQAIAARAEKKKNEKQASAKVDDEEDFDELVEKFQKLNTKCNFPKCKASTATIGQNCEHCCKRYCISHAIPEIHGCGLEAKIAARKLIAKTGSLSSQEPKKLDPIKRKMLQRRLDKKLSGMADDRKVKRKSK